MKENPEQKDESVLKWMWKRLTATQFEPDEAERNLQQKIREGPSVQGNKDSQIRYEDIVILKQIGEGSFAKVYLVKVPCKYGQRLLAMKSQLKAKLVRQKTIKYAITEAEVMSGLEHPFCLGLTFYLHTPDYMHLVFDYMECGDLAQQLDLTQKFGEQLSSFIAA